MSSPDRGELGDFLRSRREQLAPATVGLPAGTRRRTPGLRREEVAALAGIGVDWYIRLEQGRSVNPSGTTIDALARALRLSRVEHGHLRSLARSHDPRAFEREVVPPTVARLVAGLPHPAYVTGRRWDVLAWNDAAADVLTDFGKHSADDRNLLVYMFTRPDARRLFGAAWADEARRMLALFRPTHDLWASDPAFVALVARLRRDSREFARWWRAHDVRTSVAGQKVLHHRRRGALRFEYATFQSNDDPSLRLALYTPL